MSGLADHSVLANRDRPDFESGSQRLRSVDLFSGCGGLTLGLAQATRSFGIALDVSLAVDFEQSAADVFRSNFPKAVVECTEVDALFGGEIGAERTFAEQAVMEKLGGVDVLVGGPPCQGHSDLNNRTRRTDPKNALYLRMVRAAEVLSPGVVMIENVLAVQHSKPDVVGPAKDVLVQLGYRVGEAVVSIDRLGVAQRRRRHVVLALAKHLEVEPSDVLGELGSRTSVDRNVRWAIGDLVDAAIDGPFDAPPRSSDANARRMRWLEENGAHELPDELRPPCHQDGNHSYRSVYGRLHWDKPAQTITSGFTSIGQGRFMHPQELRALTAHEAARLQGFPDYFDFSSVRLRRDLATMIGNAVPPALSHSIFKSIFEAAPDWARGPDSEQSKAQSQLPKD